MFRVKILGCNGLFPSNNNNTSGYLVENENTAILLDVGSGVFSSLKQYMPPENVSAIFISHLHFDHISDLGVYNYYLELLSKRGQFNGKIRVYIKKSESAVYRAIEGLNYFELCDFEENRDYIFKEFCLNFFKMRHPTASYGITIDNGEKCFGYLGDTNTNDNVEKVFKKCSMAICHAPFMRSEWSIEKAHLCLYDALCLAKKCDTKIICSHFLPGSNMEILEKEAYESGGDFVFAEQGKCYDI